MIQHSSNIQEFPVVWLKSIVFAFSFSSPRLPWLFPFFAAFRAQRGLSSSILHSILWATLPEWLFADDRVGKKMRASCTSPASLSLRKQIGKAAPNHWGELHCCSVNMLCPSSHSWQTWNTHTYSSSTKQGYGICWAYTPSGWLLDVCTRMMPWSIMSCR